MTSLQKFKLLIVLCIISISTRVVLAQTNADVLTNETVIKMTKAALPKSLILAKIQNSNTNFDVSIDAMINLKKQGVDDDVLTAMTLKASSGNVVSASSANIVGATKMEIILSKAEPGIYYSDASVSQPVEMDPSVFSASKKGSGILTEISYGIAKTTQKSVLSGTHANLQVNSKSPVFYFVFPHRTGSDIGNESSSTTGFYNNATSPNEFLLAKFRIVKTSREVETGSFGTYSGFSSGIEEKSKVAFRYSKISPGLYKVYFETALPGGEYAFIFGGTATTRNGEIPTQKAFDFSFTGNPTVADKSGNRRRPPNPFKRKSNQDTTKLNQETPNN